MILLALIPRRLSTIQRCSVRFKSGSAKEKASQEERVSLCVLGNGAEGNPRSMFLSYNDKLFMFNCSEGSQRHLSDFGFKPSKIDHLFTTSTNFHNVSGLSSLLLARYDSGFKNFTVTGLDSQRVIEQCITFDTKLRRFKFTYENVEKEFKHQKLSIKPNVIDAGKFKNILYTCKLAPTKGRINIDKCFHAKVPRHLVATLEAGNSITLDDGAIIRPEDVFDPDQPEKRFALFECLSSTNFSSIERNEKLVEFLTNCDTIVHFSKEKNLLKSQYQKFLDSLSSPHHLLLTESNPSFSLHALHRFQAQLNTVDPILFPQLKEHPELPALENSKRIHCVSGSTFPLRPQPQLNEPVITYDLVPDLDIANCLLHKDGTSRPGLDGVLKDLRTKQESLPSVTCKSYPEFVFLGTASSLSLSIRNVSAILVNLSPDESILLDCGENCYGQLLRFYGSDQIQQVMRKLKAIFISHHHSDHHMGLVQMIEKHFEYSGNKVHLIVPPMVSKFLHSKGSVFSSLEDLLSKYNYTVNKAFVSGQKQHTLRVFDSVRAIELIPVNHCAFAFAISIEDRQGFRFVYSGDTKPCDQLVSLGAGCDLLIHEATVENRLSSFAQTNFHSTVGEAIDVAKRMKAKFTILTHFSQRYGKLPFLPQDDAENDADKNKNNNIENSQGQANIAIAFDNMRVSHEEFNRLPLLSDALKCLYSKHLETLEYRSQIYERKYGQT